MKSIIVYASRHHGSTEKLVRHLAKLYEISLLNAEETNEVDYEAYDLIGFASGIDFAKFYPPVTDLAEKLPEGKMVYALCTCARDQERYGMQIRVIAQRRGCTFLGKYGCRGYNTYGPWKIVGGMNKGCPNPEELREACSFYERMMESAEKRV